jgi:hypothetical protein
MLHGRGLSICLAVASLGPHPQSQQPEQAISILERDKEGAMAGW